MSNRNGVLSDRWRDGVCPMAFAPCLPEAERLVGLGFRYWILGRRTGEIGCWERAWSLYSGMFGLCGARLAVASLSGWASAVDMAARREIEVFPDTCGSFCRDECLAVAMIAACQHDACPAMRAYACALVESSTIDRVIGEAKAFADVMVGLEQRLGAGSIVADAVPHDRRLAGV